MNNSNNLSNNELSSIKEGLKNYNLDNLLSELFYLSSPDYVCDKLQNAYYYIAEWCAEDDLKASKDVASALFTLRCLITALRCAQDTESRQLKLYIR